MGDVVVKKVVAGVGISGIGILGAWYAGVDPAVVVNHLSLMSQNQVAQFGFCFTLAAWLHAGRVKKEIALQFAPLTAAIHSVGETLGKELADHRKILEDHGQLLDVHGREIASLKAKN